MREIMREENCIFCKILADEIPSAVVYEDDDCRAILDNAPAARGHVIILSKKHAANIFELPDDDVSRIFVVAKKIAAAVQKTYSCDGVNILQNNGEASGQTVFHLHVHVFLLLSHLHNGQDVHNSSKSLNGFLFQGGIRQVQATLLFQ